MGRDGRRGVGRLGNSVAHLQHRTCYGCVVSTLPPENHKANHNSQGPDRVLGTELWSGCWEFKAPKIGLMGNVKKKKKKKKKRFAL